MQLVGAINVPLHDSLPAPAAAAQIAHSEPRLAIIVKEGLADDLQRQAPSLLNSDAILLIEAGSTAPALLERLADVDDDAARQVIEQRLAAFDPDSITILYSSGTSGEPKAVALTHANISSNAYAVIDGLSEPSSERRMNFLPFSHIYAQLAISTPG